MEDNKAVVKTQKKGISGIGCIIIPSLLVFIIVGCVIGNLFLNMIPKTFNEQERNDATKQLYALKNANNQSVITAGDIQLQYRQKLSIPGLVDTDAYYGWVKDLSVHVPAGIEVPATVGVELSGKGARCFPVGTDHQNYVCTNVQGYTGNVLIATNLQNYWNYLNIQ